LKKIRIRGGGIISPHRLNAENWEENEFKETELLTTGTDLNAGWALADEYLN